MTVEKVLETISVNFDSSLEKLKEFLAIPSISGDPAKAPEVRDAARWLKARMEAAGFAAALNETPGHPVVTGTLGDDPAKPTVLIYGHYDVQPAVKSDGWSTEPFEPVVRDGALWCRGATDDKGQLSCHLMAVEAYALAGKAPPVNLIAVFEGEEESGSTNLEAFLIANRERLHADAVVVSDTSQYAGGVPALTYGLRGLVAVEVAVRGPAHDLHSGQYGGAVTNPANAAALIIAGLKDASGAVAVEGFYDDVRPLEEWERGGWRELGFDEAALAGRLGVPALTGERGYCALERMWARPTLDVNGLWSGYSGDGPKTIIPSRAGIKISCRLVPDQDPEKIVAALERRVRELCPPGVVAEVTPQHGARPVLLAREGAVVEAARSALSEAWGRQAVMIREGGSIPVVETFATLLAAPVVLMGFGRPDDRAHGPDERFHLEDLKRGAVASALFMENLAAKAK